MAAPAPRKLRVDNFERVSTDRQETERQRFDLQDNQEQFNLEVVDTVRMKISGTKVNTKGDWKRMLDRMQQPDRDGINLSALDRLFRPEDFAIIGEALQVFRDHKKVIVSTKEGLIEPWTPRGWETCMQAVLQAGKELAELKRRTAGGRRNAHAANKPMNTEVPYGILYRDKYSKDAKGKCQYFYEDPTPSSVGTPRREVMEMVFGWRYVERQRIYKITRRLNELGILTAGKKRKDGSWRYEPGLWSRDAVIDILQNRHYVGEHWEAGKKIDVVCPQFIDREVFEGVQQMWLIEKDNGDKLGRESNAALLGQFLVCARCKHNMYFHRRPHGRHSYRCVHYNKKHLTKLCHLKQIACCVIEPVVFLAIWRHLTQPDLLLANARAYYDSLPSRPETATLEKELTEVTARIKRTANMVRLGTYVNSDGLFDEDEGNAEIRNDQKRIAEIKAELRTAGVVDLPAKHVIESACRRIAEVTEDEMPLTFAERRPVLDKLLNLKIHYDGEYVEITGSVPVPGALAQKGRKCGERINGDYTSALYIPFKIKERVA